MVLASLDPDPSRPNFELTCLPICTRPDTQQAHLYLEQQAQAPPGDWTDAPSAAAALATATTAAGVPPRPDWFIVGPSRRGKKHATRAR